MLFSTTAQYALKIVAFISQNLDKQFTAIDLSESLDIPYKYLTSILTRLSKAEILESKKGRNGGFIPLYDIHKLTINDILKAIDEKEVDRCILHDRNCNNTKRCDFHDSWENSKKVVDKDFLSKSFYEILYCDKKST